MAIYHEHPRGSRGVAPGVDNQLDDARGTVLARLRKAGLTAPAIAAVPGWTDDRVERLLKTYGDQDEVLLRIVAPLRVQKDDTAR